MLRITYRPLDGWPRPETPDLGRYGNPFGKAEWGGTLDKLRHEVESLDGGNIVIAADFADKDIRLDGDVRTGATPTSPRVMIAFDSMHGPVKMYCDRFYKWRINVRAIANGLESLRRVDRFGIATRGEQYTGWTALPSATIALGPGQMTRKEAAEILVRTAGPEWYGDDDDHDGDAIGDAVSMLLEHPDEQLARCYKFAALNAHPDHGGNHAAMSECIAARDVLAR